MLKTCLTGLVLASLAPGALAQTTETKKEERAAPSAQMAETIGRSLVRVRYMMRYDKGEPPNAFPETLFLEYPHEEPGFLIDRTRVVTEDLMLQMRFVDKITVEFQGQIVEARPARYGVNQDALYLELASPLESASPLEFNPEADEPHFKVNYHKDDELGWAVNVSSMGNDVTLRDGQQPFLKLPTQTLIVNKDGDAVGFTMTGEVPRSPGSTDNFLPPDEWEAVTQNKYEEDMRMIEGVANRGILRTTLTFRSPRTDTNYNPYIRYYGPSEEDVLTRWEGSAAIFGDTAVIIAKLPADVTARLETITLYPEQGEPVEAEFVGTLKNWGGIIARLPASIEGSLTLAPDHITDYRDQLLYRAEVTVRGDNRTVHTGREWFREYYVGWRGMELPKRDGGLGYGGDYENDYESAQTVTLQIPFTRDGELVALPIQHRPKPGLERWSSAGRGVLLPAPELASILKNPTYDPENRPLTEDEENRFAWLGVELQPLDKDLARINNVSEQTHDGSTGAIVTYIHDDSPATEMGLQLGDILLRVKAHDRPVPLDVRAVEAVPNMEMFWQYLDSLPESRYDEFPAPWAVADTYFNRGLTKLGYGTDCTLEIVRDGEIITRDFEVTKGPHHFGSADKYKNEDVGLTVRNLTYEVRRYFHLAPDDPGVIISKIEEGSKASVAGLKPYEYIIQVNDQPVHNIAEFEAAVAGADDELRLSVKRMTKGRIVKVRK